MLKLYQRGKTWWAKGRIEFQGQPITEYIRCSTGCATEEDARRWAQEKEDRAIRLRIVGPEAEKLTFDDAVLIYDFKPKEAGYLLKVLPHLEGRLAESITPEEVRDLGPTIYPTACTDTWQRQVISPVAAVINSAHQRGRCPPIRIKGYTAQQRIDQDHKRGRESRRERTPATAEWVLAFCARADPYNAALVDFLFETGARIDQAISLTPNDLDLNSQRFWIKAQKGHEAQWVTISTALTVTLANLAPRCPRGSRTPRVFGYATRSGMRKAWATICKEAGIEPLSPHSLRHGFYTELRVRQRMDPVNAAKAGRWSNPSLPDSRYAHTTKSEQEIREAIRTNLVQRNNREPIKLMKRRGKSGNE